VLVIVTRNQGPTVLSENAFQISLFNFLKPHFEKVIWNSKFQDRKTASNSTYDSKRILKNVIFYLNPKHFVEQEDHFGTEGVSIVPYQSSRVPLGWTYKTCK